MLIGSIADDLTGATDIAGFFANAGLGVVQYAGVPEGAVPADAEAVVISLKTRSTPPDEAVAQSLAALSALRGNGCPQIYFKYCSTFDSTARGNIGPVTDALMAALATDFTVVCPTLPVNGRTVKNGILLVNGVPLAETGMRHHPVTPMTDSDLVRLMERQSKGRAMRLELPVVEAGREAIGQKLRALRAEGCSYAILDAVSDAHLDALAAALDELPLLTGGSGLGGARARRLRERAGTRPGRARDAARPRGGRTVILSGSCSEMTNRQVAAYKTGAPHIKVATDRALSDALGYARELADWAEGMGWTGPAPLLYATAGQDELRRIQDGLGAEAASAAVERLFSRLASLLQEKGVTNFIVAGGETAGAVTAALGTRAFRIGPEIAPGVPWVKDLDSPLSLALKSGNFGDERFFFTAQEMMG